MADSWDTPPTPEEMGSKQGDAWSMPPTPEEMGSVSLSAGPTAAFHFARHLAGGLGDKIIAAEEALSESLHDKSGKASFGDAYNRNLAFNDKLLEESDKANPKARWAGNVAGIAGNLAALGLAGRALGASGEVLANAPRGIQLLAAAKEGAKLGGVLGGVGGYGQSRSDSTLGTAADTALGAGLGALAGAGAPYAAEGLGRGAQALGSKAQDLAAWLKVHSLHPTPKLGEAMADLPGGELGVGKELLEQGLGGLTKKGTARQIGQALNESGEAISELAQNHDAGGGAPILLDKALAKGREVTTRLQAEPTTEAAGDRLTSLVGKYEKLYAGRPVPASQALTLKRALGDEAYGAGETLRRAGDKVSGDYGAGVSKLERAVDDALDNTLGPKFEQANLTFRRLLGSNQAAERSAARAQANQLLGLLHSGAAGAGYLAHGTPGALAAGAGSLLFDKYGSQLGARALYSPVAGALNGLGSALRYVPPAAESALAAEQLSGLPTGLSRPISSPAMAQNEKVARQNAMLAALQNSGVQ